MVIHLSKAWKCLGPILLGCVILSSGLACASGPQNSTQTASSGTPTIVAPFPTPTPTIVAPFPTPTPTPPMSLSPTAINPSSNACSLDASGNTYTCIVTLQLTGFESVNWTETNDQNIQVNPPSGSLDANQTMQQVSLEALPCQHITFTFSDSIGDTFYTDWTCP